MKTTKRVICLISAGLAVYIAPQAWAVSIIHEDTGATGIFLAIFFMEAALIGLTMTQQKLSNILMGSFYGFSGLIALINSSDIYEDLKFYSIVAFIFCAFSFYLAFSDKIKKPQANYVDAAPQVNQITPAEPPAGNANLTNSDNEAPGSLSQFCSGCGAPIQAGQGFCAKCGKKL